MNKYILADLEFAEDEAKLIHAHRELNDRLQNLFLSQYFLNTCSKLFHKELNPMRINILQGEPL